MSNVESLLKSKLCDVDVAGLKAIKKEYFELLIDNPFSKAPTSGNFYEMINYFKRKDETNPICIGPYKNITPFEAANRIASDLVIINGLLQLERNNPNLKEASFILRLGTTHKKEKGDITIKIGNNEFEGEAFNVAPSFLKTKLNKTLKKWKNNDKLRYILINKDAFEEIHFNSLDKRVVKVEKWHE